MRAWLALLRGHRALAREFTARLLAEHDLTLNDYEVLAHLSRAPDRRMRRIDLAERLQLSPSGITRLLDGLERAGLAEKATCESDARVTYAVLTDAGYDKLQEASTTHLADIEAAFGCFREDELETIGSLTARLNAGAS